MVELKKLEAWFITGSQDLYGQQTLDTVAEHSKKIAQALSDSQAIPVNIVFKPVLTTSGSIYQLCSDANRSSDCIGLITWMHTFSPAKMWIPGLKALQKPLVHLHTQFNKELPWATIDMEFMNLNQSAHGDRFRMIVNEAQTIVPEQPLPKLPVARAIWMPKPDLKVAAGAWILAGGAHHTGFSQALTAQHLEDFASMAAMEFLLIDDDTTISTFKKEIRWNDMYYRLTARM